MITRLALLTGSCFLKRQHQTYGTRRSYYATLIEHLQVAQFIVRTCPDHALNMQSTISIFTSIKRSGFHLSHETFLLERRYPLVPMIKTPEMILPISGHNQILRSYRLFEIRIVEFRLYLGNQTASSKVKNYISTPLGLKSEMPQDIRLCQLLFSLWWQYSRKG